MDPQLQAKVRNPSSSSTPCPAHSPLSYLPTRYLGFFLSKSPSITLVFPSSSGSQFLLTLQLYCQEKQSPFKPAQAKPQSQRIECNILRERLWFFRQEETSSLMECRGKDKERLLALASSSLSLKKRGVTLCFSADSRLSCPKFPPSTHLSPFRPSSQRPRSRTHIPLRSGTSCVL